MTAISEDLIKIGDFARLASTNLRTLRYYEELGLLTPAERSKGGFRYYRSTDVNRVRMIRNLQELGLHLDRIGELMRRPEPDADNATRVRLIEGALNEQRAIIDERIRALEEQRAQIVQAASRLQDCLTCPTHPTADNNYCEPCSGRGQPLPDILSALF